MQAFARLETFRITYLPGAEFSVTDGLGKARPTARSCGREEKATDCPRSFSPEIEIKQPDGKHALLVASTCPYARFFDVDVAAAVLDLVDGKSRNDYLPRITGWSPWEGLSWLQFDFNERVGVKSATAHSQ